ncbi:uncharacterized protein [Dysidea avara]|uniref:uncharacterized protein n=1 Tax=Dysidea avara TaxID=196820 RepID=UPI00331A6EB9
MAYAFEKLKYEVMSKRNMTKQQLLALVVNAASREYDVSYRWLVFMFSGHGGASQTLFDRYGNPNGQGSGLIYSQEGGALQMDDLINNFKSDQHPHLGDMARLLFDVCRGAQIDDVAYSTFPNHKSFERVGSGGLWINLLATALRTILMQISLLCSSILPSRNHLARTCKILQFFQTPQYISQLTEPVNLLQEAIQSTFS